LKDQVVPLNIGKSARFEALLANRVPAAIMDPPYTTTVAAECYRLLVDLRRSMCRICRFGSTGSVRAADKRFRNSTCIFWGNRSEGCQL